MMAVAEATRLYQAMLEGDRRTRELLAGVMSAESELTAAAEEVKDARAVMERSWLTVVTR